MSPELNVLPMSCFFMDKDGINQYLYEQLFVYVESLCLQLYRKGCRVWSRERCLYDSRTMYDGSDTEAKAHLQGDMDAIFVDHTELIESCNVHVSTNLVPWKERLVETRNQLRVLCDYVVQIMYNPLNFGEYEFRDESTDRFCSILSRYHTYSKAYHMIQVVQRRYICSIRFLTNALDNLAQTCTTIFGLSVNWENLYFPEVNELIW